MLGVNSAGAAVGASMCDMLREGFALTVCGVAEPFARLAAETLRLQLGSQDLDRGLDEAVEHVLSGLPGWRFTPTCPGPEGAGRPGSPARYPEQPIHPRGGGAPGARRRPADLRTAALGRGSGGIWKPASDAYDYALAECGVDAEDAMLVAVPPWDINGAARAGLGTAGINRAEGRYPAYFPARTLAWRRCANWPFT